MKQAGFRNTDISVLFPENVGSKTLVTRTYQSPGRRRDRRWIRCGAGRRLGMVGRTLAPWHPRPGPFVAAGPIMAALAGMGVGGAAGGITGALIGLGIPESVASAMRAGSEMAAFLFRAFGQFRLDERAKEILERTGAPDTHPVQRPPPTTPKR